MADIDNYLRTYFEGIDTTLSKTAAKVKTSIDGVKASNEKLREQSMKVSASLLKQRMAEEALANKHKFIAEWSDKLRVNTGKLSQIMANQGLVFDKAGGVVDKAGRQVKDINKVMKTGKAETKGFRMELLGVMFAGMALDRTFGGMVRSQLELFGVNEMFGAMLTTVLLPVIEPLANMLYAIMNWFMDLPEPVQKVIGIFVIAAATFGMVLAIIGQFGLGITSLVTTIQKFGLFFSNLFGPTGIIGKAFIGLWGTISGFITWVATTLGVTFGAAAAIIIGVIVAITALIFGAIEAWKKNFFGFKDSVIGIWNSIKDIIGGFVTFFKGIWELIVGIFTLNGDKISSGFEKIKDGIFGMFKGLANMVINVINSLVSLVISALAQIVRAAQFVWNLVPGHKDVTWYQDIMALGKGKSLIPTFQSGGIMPYTGLAMLHKGETVTPANESNYSPTINVYANVSSDYDVRKLASELSKYWMSDLSRYSKIRG